MKQLPTASVIKFVKNSIASFNEQGMGLLHSLLSSLISEQQLNEIAVELKARKRKPLTMDDICRIAYVHIRSIRENDGESPTNRIKAYCTASGFDYDSIEIGTATEILLNCEIILLTKEANQRKHQCRVYSIPEDVRQALKITNDLPVEKSS